MYTIAYDASDIVLIHMVKRHARHSILYIQEIVRMEQYMVEVVAEVFVR